MTDGTDRNETRGRRPHALRFSWPTSTALPGPHICTTSASQLPIRVNRPGRALEGAGTEPRLPDSIRASHRPRIPRLLIAHGGEILPPICALGCTNHSSHRLTASSLAVISTRRAAPYRIPESGQPPSKSRVDSWQTESILAPVPRAVHRGIRTNLRAEPTATHISKRLIASAHDRSVHKIGRQER
jgi:hypothetical protein